MFSCQYDSLCVANCCYVLLSCTAEQMLPRSGNNKKRLRCSVTGALGIVNKKDLYGNVAVQYLFGVPFDPFGWVNTLHP